MDRYRRARPLPPVHPAGEAIVIGIVRARGHVHQVLREVHLDGRAEVDIGVRPIDGETIAQPEEVFADRFVAGADTGRVRQARARVVETVRRQELLERRRLGGGSRPFAGPGEPAIDLAPDQLAPAARLGRELRRLDVGDLARGLGRQVVLGEDFGRRAAIGRAAPTRRSSVSSPAKNASSGLSA